MTFDEALLDFLRSRESKNNSPDTITWYEGQVARFHAWLEEKETNGSNWLRPEVIEQFLAEERARGLKPGTVNARYRALRSFFNWLKVRGYLGGQSSPLDLVDQPRVPEPDRDHVTVDELRALYASLPAEGWTAQRDRAILLVLFWSGLRVGELCALTLHDVDTRTQLITVRQGKGGKSRIVPCSPQVPEVLLSYLYQRPPWKGAGLWLSSDGAGGARGELTAEGVRQMLIRRCRAGGVRYLHPHAWRHGFAMTLLNAGAEMSSISAMMGHSSTTLTESVYAKWLTEGLSAEYLRVLERIEKQEKNRP